MEKSNLKQRKGDRLDQELSTWLREARLPTDGEPLPSSKVRALIAPHAGFAYSGPTAAFAYKCVDTSQVTRVFILGPSHKVYLEGCSLSQCSNYETPLGRMELDQDIIQELHDSRQFSSMTSKTDEDEHSIEMHLPFVQAIMKG
jgi:AmmeMemoRadiSam system protein B